MVCVDMLTFRKEKTNHYLCQLFGPTIQCTFSTYACLHVPLQLKYLFCRALYACTKWTHLYCVHAYNYTKHAAGVYVHVYTCLIHCAISNTGLYGEDWNAHTLCTHLSQFLIMIHYRGSGAVLVSISILVSL